MHCVTVAQLQWLIQITTAKKEFGRVNRKLSNQVHVQLSCGLAHVEI